MRKAMNSWTRKGHGFSYRSRPTIYREAISLARNLLEPSKDWQSVCEQSTAAANMAMVYGKPPGESRLEEEAAVAKLGDFASRMTQGARPGSHAVDILPWLKHVPTRYVGTFTPADDEMKLNLAIACRLGSKKRNSLLLKIR